MRSSMCDIHRMPESFNAKNKAQFNFRSFHNFCSILFTKWQLKAFQTVHNIYQSEEKTVKSILINPLKTKRGLLYLKTQFVPRSKHFSSRL